MKQLATPPPPPLPVSTPQQSLATSAPTTRNDMKQLATPPQRPVSPPISTPQQSLAPPWGSRARHRRAEARERFLATHRHTQQQRVACARKLDFSNTVVVEPKIEVQDCIVCMDRPSSRLLVPCMHFCVCSSCASMLQKPTCPKCRTKIKEIRKVFF